MIISRAPKSFRWFYGVSLACGAMCLILAIGGRTIAAGVFGYCWPVRRCGLSVIGKLTHWPPWFSHGGMEIFDSSNKLSYSGTVHTNKRGER